MIKPTIGRIVILNARENETKPYGQFPAIITKVRSDRIVDVVAFNAARPPTVVALPEVPLIQPEDERPNADLFVEWMPYQIGQGEMTKKIAEQAGIKLEQPSVSGNFVSPASPV